MKQGTTQGMAVEAGVTSRDGQHASIRSSHHYLIEAFDKSGNPLWTEEFDNIVVTSGLNDIVDKYYKGAAYNAAHYVGLTSAAPAFAAGDTMAAHPGWTEVTDYTEATREVYTPGAVAGGSVSNSASVAEFSINATVTVGGTFLTTDSTKGGTSGVLIGGGAFSADRSLGSGDTLRVTITASAASA